MATQVKIEKEQVVASEYHSGPGTGEMQESGGAWIFAGFALLLVACAFGVAFALL